MLLNQVDLWLLSHDDPAATVRRRPPRCHSRSLNWPPFRRDRAGGNTSTVCMYLMEPQANCTDQTKTALFESRTRSGRRRRGGHPSAMAVQGGGNLVSAGRRLDVSGATTGHEAAASPSAAPAFRPVNRDARRAGKPGTPKQVRISQFSCRLPMPRLLSLSYTNSHTVCVSTLI
jgi:hypothetical protein